MTDPRPAILLKMPNWVGDCVMATPALAALRRTFPEARIDALARRAPAGVLLDNPDLTQVLAADDRRLTPAERARLREARYDAVALFPNSLRSAWLALRLGIPRRAGFARGVRRLLLTDAIPYDPRHWQTSTPRPLSRKSLPPAAPSAAGSSIRPSDPRDVDSPRDTGVPPGNQGPSLETQSGITGGTPVPRAQTTPEARNLTGDLALTTPPAGHMVDYYLRVAQATARSLGRELVPAPPDLVLPINPDSAAKLEALLHAQGLSNCLLIGLNPGAAYGNAKRYPLSQLAAAANSLLQSLRNPELRIQNSELPLPSPVLVSTAAPNESFLNDELAAQLEAPLHRLGEQLDLQGLTALLDHFAVLLTNDSGAMHMAAALGTPTLALFGPTDWNVTRPWSANARVLRESPACAPCFLRECPIDHRCMTAITPQAVSDAARELMRGRVPNSIPGREAPTADGF